MRIKEISNFQFIQNFKLLLWFNFLQVLKINYMVQEIVLYKQAIQMHNL